MDSLKKVANNYLIQVVGKVFTVFIGLIAVGILTRYLGQEGFGSYTVAQTYLLVFGTIVEFGMTLTFIQMVSVEEEQEQQLVNRLMGLRLFSGLLFYSLAPLLVQFFPYAPTTKLAVFAGVIGFFFMTSTGMFIGFFQKHLIMWRFALSEIINRATFLFLIIVFALFGASAIGMMWAITIANIIWFISIIFLIRPFLRVRPSIHLATWKEALRRSWPIGVSTICNLIYLKGDIIFLGIFHGEASVGIYGVAYKVIDVVTMVPVMLMGLLLPQLTRFWNLKDRNSFQRFFQHAFDFFIMVSLPILVATQVMAKPISLLIGGEAFGVSGPVLQLLIFSVLGLFLSSLYGHLIVAIEKQRIMTWGYAITAVITIVGYLIFIPPYGMWGAAGMTVFSEMLIALLTFIVVSRTTHLYPRLRVSLKVIASTAVMYLVLVILPAWHVLVVMGIGVFVYGAVLFSLGGIKLATLKQILSKTP